MTHADRTFATLSVVLVAVVQLWGCGAKGRPRAPIILIPVPVTELTVRRLGGEVYAAFTLPTRNQDGTEPADLARVDVYAMTTQPRVRPDRRLGLEEFEEAATLVTSVEVRPRDVPPDIPLTDPSGAPSDPRPGQGFQVDVLETLGATTLVPVDPWADERGEEEDEDDTSATVVSYPRASPVLAGPLQREYLVVSVSTKGRESAAARVAVPLMRPPAPPPAAEITYTEAVVNITWELPPGVRETVQAPSAATASVTAAPVPTAPSATPAPPPVAPSVTPAPPAVAPPDAPVQPTVAPPATPVTTAAPAGTTPASAAAREPVLSPPAGQTATPVPAAAGGAASQTTPGTSIPTAPIPRTRTIVDWPPASRYDVYEIVERLQGPVAMPSPLNPAPLAIPEYADRRVEFGVERCYAVSTLDVVGGLDVRSGLSAQTCVTFVDTFAPGAPTGLVAVGSAGAVGLSWRSSGDEDLYLVLRGLPPGETLQPLTPEPVPADNYTDTTAEPGVQYVYAVRAVDTATPPNVSPLSNQVEAAAR